MRPDTVRILMLYNASPSRHASVDLVAAGIPTQRYITSIIFPVCEYCAMQERFAKRGNTSAQERLNRILATNGAEDQRCADEKTWKRERFSPPVIFNMMITNIARGSGLHVTSDNYLDSNIRQDAGGPARVTGAPVAELTVAGFRT